MNPPDLASKGAAAPAYPPAPEGLTLYMVGDIHGRLDLLRAVQRQIDEDKARSGGGRAIEVYLGDYIDRGLDPAGVVSRLIARADSVETVFLRGNHEQMLLDFLDGTDGLDDWLSVGATATLLSYGLPPGLLSSSVPEATVRHRFEAALPEEHRQFYGQTRHFAPFGPYLAVHAGLRPGVTLEHQDAQDLISIRREFLSFTGSFGFIVVHGHTPAPAPELRPNRINIDTAAFVSSRLTVLKIDAGGARIMPDAIAGR